MPASAYRSKKSRSTSEEDPSKSVYRKANVGFIVSTPSSYSNNCLLTGLYLCGCLGSEKKYNLTVFCFHGGKIVSPDSIVRWKKTKEEKKKVAATKGTDINDIDETEEETKTVKDNDSYLPTANSPSSRDFLWVPLPLKVEKKSKKWFQFSKKYQIVTEIDEQDEDISLTLGGKEEALRDQDFIICVLDACDTDPCAKLIKTVCGLGGSGQKREHGIFSLVREVRVGSVFTSFFDNFRHVAAIEGSSGIEVNLNRKNGALSLVYPKGSICVKRITRANQNIGLNLANIIEDCGVPCIYDRSFSTFTWGNITPIYLGVTNALTGDMTMYDCMMKLENRRVIAAGLREYRLCMDSISTDKKWLPRSNASLNLSLYWLEMIFVLPNFFFQILYFLGVSPLFSENIPSIIQSDLTDQNEFHPKDDKYLTYSQTIFDDIEKVGLGQGIGTPVTTYLKQSLKEVVLKKEGITRSIYYQKSDQLLQDIIKLVGPIKMKQSLWEVRKHIIRLLCIFSFFSMVLFLAW